MRLAILTSNHLRHNFFAATLGAKFDVVALLQEGKKRDPSQKGKDTELAPAVQDYFNERAKSEEVFFQAYQDLPHIESERITPVTAGAINDQELLRLLKDAEPDYLAVFGSSILGEDIIAAFPNRIINMHLGLSPYYRGSGTNFWPLYEEKPEYVGVTIHYLDAGIDTGKVIVQGRPEIDADDSPHSVGNKTIVEGANLMVEVLRYFADGGTIEGTAQNHDQGKLYLFKDCTADHIAGLVAKCENGLFEEYIRRQRDGAVDEVSLVTSDSWN